MTTTAKLLHLLPDFLIIGAGKSGTTSLNNYLRQHPEIYISPRKEPNFFGYELSHMDEFDDLSTQQHFKNSVTDLDSYMELFRPAAERQLKGETSNTYLYHELAPERIKHYIPDVKLIAILRQPAERLYSRFLHLARENQLPSSDFSDCLDRSSIWWKRGDLVPEGFYHKNLSRYFSLFKKEQIKVYLYEELKNNPVSLMQSIYRFLEIDDTVVPNVEINYNSSGFIRNKLLDRFLGQHGLIPKTIQGIMSQHNYQKLKQNIFIQKHLNRIRTSNLHRPGLDHDLKRHITHDIYRDDIQNLSRLINKDLNPWIEI